MTEGRFETIHNLRPKNWDGRRHWTNWHHLYDCEKDHLERESCPFHDLRAGGQFQYEYWGGGEHRAPIEPARLNDRANGDRMDFAKGGGTQVGGLGDIPLDVEPGRPLRHNKHPGKTVMYTKKNPLNRGLFGTYPYMPDPLDDKAAARGLRSDTGGGGMRAGRVDAFGHAPEWIGDPYSDRVDRGRIHHLKAGPLNYRPEDRPPWMPEGEPAKRKKRVYGAFYAGKPSGIINDIEWIPDPLLEGGVKKHARPFRTWHTRTKWSMPTYAPWSTGKITSEPFRGPNLDTTTAGLPSLDTYRRVNMTQTIGREAALASLKPPEPVRLKCKDAVQLMKKNVVGSCHIYLQSVRHINSQRIVQNGLMYCGYRMYTERQAVATQKILDGTVSTSSLLSSTLKTKKNGRMKEKKVYDLAAHIEELFSTNNSEEVIPLITSFSPQKEGMQTASPLYTCESLIAVFLYSGCGESAFTLWRLASTSLDFSPSCMTLMMFAVYTLLVDGKVQEAHDLMAMAALNSEGKGGIPAAASSLEYVKDWMVVYAGACMQNNEGVVFPFIKEGRVEVEEKIKTAFINILRLSLDVVKKRKTQLSRERLQMTLYATISLMKIYESEEHSKKLREILRDYTFSSSFSKEEYSVLDTLLYVADILIRMGKEKGTKQDDDCYSCFFPEDVSFLITYMFPLPLIYSLDINNNNNNNNESTPQRCLLSSTGLQMYQSLLFVSSSIHQEEGVEYKNTVPSSSSSMYTTTVGAVVLKWILENHFETLFFFSIVSYDITTTTRRRSKRKDEQWPLMGELIEMFIGNELSDVVSCKLGKQILPLIHAARNETSWENSLEDVDVCALVYISHILSSFISVEDSRRYKNKNKKKCTSEEDNDNDNGGGSSGGGKSISVIGGNHIFYIELLASIMKLISDKNLKSWYRFVSHVTYEVTRENHYSSPTVVNRCIEGELQLQLHKRWWLPMLFMYVDKEREEFLCMQLLQKQQQRDSSLSSSLFHELSEWDHCVCVIIYILHRNNNNNNKSTVVEKTTEISHDVRRLLVCRFVRWEWFLKSLFDLAAGMHNTGRETYYNKWSDLLHVCIQALQNCRKYYRRDIAKEFIEVMFFPFPPPSHLETHRNGSRNTTIHFLELLINGSTNTNSHHHESSFMFLQLRWSVVHEISRWLHTSHENWDYMRALHSLLPIGPYDETQRFLSLRYLIEDLLAGETNNNKRKNKMITMMYTTHPGKREEERVCKVFHWYEESYRKHLSFITPQLLFPLARAMRRASLVDKLSKLVRDTFLCIQSGFHAPRPLWPSRLVEETLQFFYLYHDTAVMRMNMDENKRDVKNNSTSLHHNAMYDNGRAMMIGFIEIYLLALWEHEYFTELGMILLKADSSHTRDSNDSPSVVSSWSIHKKTKKDTGDYINIYLSAEVVYLLPVAEREALRVLLLLTFAQQCEEEMYVHALMRLPRNKADPEQVAACIHRLAMEERYLFASLEETAKRVVRGGCRLREACASMTALQRNVIGKQKENKINIKKKSGGNEVRTVRDLNRCIDRCDWATALQAIPQILTEPLHVARKALLACEKAPKGTAWEGAMNIFLNSKYTWESSNSQEKEKEEGEQKQKQKRDPFAHKGKSSVHATTTTSSSRSYHSTIGVQECGRVMTLLADAKRWRESLAVFASLGPRGVDAYTFSQACFSLRAGGHAELAIDLWASWRAIVGDYVEPTASMCGNFIRCGVVGNTAMADAACILLKTSLCNHAYMKIKKEGEGEGEKGGGKMHTESFSSSSYHHVRTPGTTLPLCMQDEEGTVIALLRDRCNESWQEALRLALASGRPRVIDAVARESPRNYHVYECLMQHAVRGGRRLSLEEKSSIVGHLNVKAALASENNNNNSGPAAVDGRAIRLLQELLGDDDDKERREEEKGAK